MASAAKPASDISFGYIQDVFHIMDLPDHHAIHDQDYTKGKFVSAQKNGLKFVNCKFSELSHEGALSLLNCKVERVFAKGNILLKGCSGIEHVKTDKQIAAIQCTDIRIATCELIYFFETSPTQVKVYGKTVTVLSKEEAETIIYKQVQFFSYLQLSKDTKQVLLDNTTCRGDIIFPEDSRFPLSQRQVILTNGSSVLGKVIGGNLVELFFGYLNKMFTVIDIPDKKAIYDKDYSNIKFVSVKKTELKFVNCKFGELSHDGALSLVKCKVERVVAKGNVLLKNCFEIEHIKTDAQVAVFQCGGIKKITGEHVYLTETPIDGITLEGNCTLRLTKKKEIMIFQKTELDMDFQAYKFIRQIILDGSIFKGNILFPEDSKWELSERQVILKNGSKLVGKVVGATLKDENSVKSPDDSKMDLYAELD